MDNDPEFLAVLARAKNILDQTRATPTEYIDNNLKNHFIERLRVTFEELAKYRLKKNSLGYVEYSKLLMVHREMPRVVADMNRRFIAAEIERCNDLF